jgi:hypothetical protein
MANNVRTVGQPFIAQCSVSAKTGNPSINMNVTLGESLASVRLLRVDNRGFQYRSRWFVSHLDLESHSAWISHRMREQFIRLGEAFIQEVLKDRPEFVYTQDRLILADAMDFPMTLKVLPLEEAVIVTPWGSGQIFGDIRSSSLIEEARGAGRPKLVGFSARYGEFVVSFLATFRVTSTESPGVASRVRCTPLNIFTNIEDPKLWL